MILDSVLGWLLDLHPALSIILVSFIISMITILAYKLFTNQSLMKDLRQEINELQKEVKDLKNSPDKAMKVQTRMMETNMKYMSESMRPTLFTFVPIILIFGWLNSHMGYYQIVPNTPFEVTAKFQAGIGGEASIILPEELVTDDPSDKKIVSGKVVWILEGASGLHNITVGFGEQEYSRQVLVTQERKYIAPVVKIKNAPVTEIIVGNERVVPFKDVPIIKYIPWINGWGWLGTYLFFSLLFSIGLRRLLKIY